MAHYSVEYREGDLVSDRRVNVPKKFFEGEDGGVKRGLRVRLTVDDDPEVMAKAAFELMYMDVDGRATEFNDLPNSRGTYNIFNRTITVNRVLFEDKDAGSSASLGIEVMVDFDIYLAASFSAKWTGISAGLSAYAIINS